MRRSIIFTDLCINLFLRRCTSKLRTLPSVFVIGATKAASSSITSVVWDHPSHVSPLAKEHMYLQKLPSFDSNWERPPVVGYFWGRYKNGHVKYSQDGYRKFFPMKSTMERRKRKTGEAFSSECDPFNLYCSTALKRIKSFSITPKIILSLRDPISRAYSDWNMHRVFGEKRSFEEAIDDELKGKEKQFRKRFLNQSTYAPYVKAWLNNFDSSQIKIIKAEDYFTNSEIVAKEIYSFLGLQDHEINWEKIKRNQNKLPYNGHKINIDTKIMLKEYFKLHNERLYEMTGKDFGW